MRYVWISLYLLLLLSACQVREGSKQVSLKSATIIQYTIKGRFMSR